MIQLHASNGGVLVAHHISTRSQQHLQVLLPVAGSMTRRGNITMTVTQVKPSGL